MFVYGVYSLVLTDGSRVRDSHGPLSFKRFSWTALALAGVGRARTQVQGPAPNADHLSRIYMHVTNMRICDENAYT